MNKLNLINKKKTVKSKLRRKNYAVAPTAYKKLIFKKNKFIYSKSLNSKIFFNRKKLWFLSSHINFNNKIKSFSQAFNFGTNSGLNSNKIGFWRFKTNLFIWRQSGDVSDSSVYYKPMRGSWKKLKKKNRKFKNFLPLYKSSSFSFNFFNSRLFRKNVKKPYFFNAHFLSKTHKKTIVSPAVSSKKFAINNVNKQQKNVSNYTSFSLLKNLNLIHKRQPLHQTDDFSSNFYIYSFLNNDNNVARFNRFFDSDPQYVFNLESDFLKEFVYKKKTIRGLVTQDRNDNRKNFIKSSTKYYYYYYRNDPLSGSYFFDKIVSVFASRFNKKMVRKTFYKLFFEINSEFSINMLYFVIISLKPEYINVKVRRGREHYEAPILASESKSIIKAIKFFKKAVVARRYEESFYSKLRGELYDFFCWDGYKNIYYEDYVSVSKKNMHLRHFRSVNRY